MSEFFGQTYAYPLNGTIQRDASWCKTRNSKPCTRIGVLKGLGDIWIVGYIADSGAHRRIKSVQLPPDIDPNYFQLCLDDWAQKKGLEAIS